MREHLKSILLLFCLLAAVCDEGSSCDISWIRSGDVCYRIFPDSFAWLVANIKCSMEGGELASISSVSVFVFLAHHVDHTNGSKFWVGLRRNRNDGELIWNDGTRGVKSQPWVKIPKPQEPSMSIHNLSFSDVHGENCFAYDGTSVVKTPCFERLGLICSRNATKSKRSCTVHAEKEHSFLGESTGNCLFRAPAKTTKDKVDELCRQYGGHFVDLDAMLRDGLTAFYNHHVLANDGSKYWTGFTWNGTSLSHTFLNSIKQEFSIPVVAGSGSCITVQFNFTDILQTHLYQTECEDEAYVVCSVLPDDLATETVISTRPTVDPHDVLQMDGLELTCPDGYNWKADKFNRYCYWETSFETNQLSWNEAEMYCRGFGGHLSSFHSLEEEKRGLSFQYGSLAHPYWIGLYLDTETETYKWSDGTPVDYNNWAPGHPDHKDKRLRCVAMEAQAKHWVSSLCGVLSWFICKVPARANQPVPVLPTPIPLEPCDGSKSSEIETYFFEGACYFVIDRTFSWHRANQFCEDQGARLVSIHSVEEVGFLLRLLNDSPTESNRVWIGLSSFGSDGNFLWTDWSPVDFTFFSDNEPDNFQNQEKCCNMYTKNGQWNDENCNAAMGFICKRRNDTSSVTVIPSTVDPTIGNCKKGWIAFHDRCYYVGGKREKERVNWTVAIDRCQKHGGYLTSIRDEKDQSFLSYLLQTLGVDAWIGLHDTIQSGRYYWVDNSELMYTKWAPGEPSFFGIMEDCVKMVYDHLDSGVWKDDECGRELGYICQSKKDPELPPPPIERGLNCLHPEGWLKLENMCFKMFVGNDLNGEQAESACEEEGGHLVSVSNQKVKAVVSYLATEVNQPFFIGLRYEKDSQRVSWLNGHEVLVTNWEKNEPSGLAEDTCFASTTENYWKKVSCEEEKPYICQITTGEPKKVSRYTGECPPSSRLWSPGSNSFCYILDKDQRYDWFTANLMCFRYASHLASIHSKSEIEDIKKLMKPGVKSVYIGLMRNKKGGFAWMDDSPVDFVNWDEHEPANFEDQCVEMIADTMKWRVIPCIAKKNYVCQDRKSTLVYEDSKTAEYIDEQKGLSTSAIYAVVFSILIGVVLIVAAALYGKRSSSGARFRRHDRNQSVSFENALYNVGNASMELRDDKNPL